MTMHVYCQQTQDWGRNSNHSISFSGDTLKSYAARIARIVPAAICGNIMLVTNRNYSVTTRQHIGRAIRAWEGNYIRVETLGDAYFDGPLRPEEHERNLSALETEYNARVGSIIRMVSEPYTSYQDMLLDAAKPANDYAQAFTLRTPNIDTAVDLSRILDNRAKRLKRQNQPAQVWKRTMKEQARRIREAERERINAEFRRTARLNAAEKIAAWRAGQYVTLPYDAQTLENGSAMLRVQRDKGMIETSLGAEISIEDAHKMYRFIRGSYSEMGFTYDGTYIDHNAGGWTGAFIGSMRLGHWTLTHITERAIRVGCHYIAQTEINHIAMEMGWS